MLAKYQIMRMGEGSLSPVREYEDQGVATRCLDRFNRALLWREVPLCEVLVLMRNGELIRGASAVMST